MALPIAPELDALNNGIILLSCTCFAIAVVICLTQLVMHFFPSSSKASGNSFVLGPKTSSALTNGNGKVQVKFLADASKTSTPAPSRTSQVTGETNGNGNAHVNGSSENALARLADQSLVVDTRLQDASFASSAGASSADELLLLPTSSSSESQITILGGNGNGHNPSRCRTGGNGGGADRSIQELQRGNSWSDLQKKVLTKQSRALHTEVEKLRERVRGQREERERLVKVLKCEGKALKELKELVDMKEE